MLQSTRSVAQRSSRPKTCLCIWHRSCVRRAFFWLAQMPACYHIFPTAHWSRASHQHCLHPSRRRYKAHKRRTSPAGWPAKSRKCSRYCMRTPKSRFIFSRALRQTTPTTSCWAENHPAHCSAHLIDAHCARINPFRHLTTTTARVVPCMPSRRAMLPTLHLKLPASRTAKIPTVPHL